MVSSQPLIFDSRVFVFETLLHVRAIEVNTNQYLTLESLTALMVEAREQFLHFKGIKEISENNQGLVVDKLQVHIISRARVREALLFEVGIEQIDDEGGSIAIRVTRMSDNSLIANSRQHFVNYDYRLQKLTTINDVLKQSLVPKHLLS
ncbi:thioesterase family protein [uncultured Psychrobacter sp.]|uniref:thioesterase family protein n=1 Tax=unclassified Psychrobacter TaxID=196806 RepID=UPI00293D7F92|nr:thioesterase family protein [uncultured Psychrobacter sp.]